MKYAPTRWFTCLALAWFTCLALAGLWVVVALRGLVDDQWPGDDSEATASGPTTPPPNGSRNMSRSINALECLTINGVEQWMQIQSNDTTQPVLLVLHGGPGFACMPLFHAHNAALEDDFIVVNWDQRGAGRAYSPTIPAASMTLRQFLADLRLVTRHLKDRFRRDKIYLLGHSFGTVLGLLEVHAHPEDYYAFISVGQVIGPIANEIVMYEWILGQARRARNARAIRELTLIGHPDRHGRYPHDGPGKADPYDTAEYWMGYFGGSLYRKHGSAEIETWLLKQPVYRGKWGRKWLKGAQFSGLLFDDPAAWELDFRKTIRAVKVPVYFLQGHHDYETPWPLVEEYAALLKAPKKELIWFEKSAHFPFYEQSDDFNRAMVKTVKANTYP